LITESNGTDLSLPDRPNTRGNGQGNQDFEDTGISPSQETVSFDIHNRVSYDEIDPNSLFNLQDKPQDEPQDQLTNDNDIKLAPEVTIRKRGRPKGSQNRVYSPIAEEDKRTTRLSQAKASTSLNITSKQAYTAYVKDNPDKSPYDFSFDLSYEDSNGDQD
jgi:hypothetical protein